MEGLARSSLPAFGKLPGADGRIVPRLDDWLASVPVTVRRSYKAGLWALEGAAVFTHGKPFTRLAPVAQTEVLVRHEQSTRYIERTLLTGLAVPLKWLHFDAPHMQAHVGCRYILPAVKEEQPRWLSQVTNGREATEDLELECEVVVIGTGAGGAAAAYELASRGRAVLLLEEGDYHRRGSFRGRASVANREMYRDQAVTISLGNVGIPVWAGRAVGGSTVINSGTCYRAPERVFDAGSSELGLPSRVLGRGPLPLLRARGEHARRRARRPEVRGSHRRPHRARRRQARLFPRRPPCATHPAATDRASVASAARRAPSAPPT